MCKVNTVPYEQIEMVKIFYTTFNRFAVQFFIANEDEGRLFIIKKDCEDRVVFGKDTVDSHWDTDWSYTNGGAESDKEKKEIDDILDMTELLVEL